LPSAYSLTSHTHAQLHDQLHDFTSYRDHNPLTPHKEDGIWASDKDGYPYDTEVLISNVALKSSLSAYSIVGHTHDHGSLTGLLDNDHPQYSLSSHIHDYLPLSGGTVTGVSYFNSGLSASTLSGDGSALDGVTGIDMYYQMYRDSAFEPNGFPESCREGTNISYTAATRTFTLSPTGSNDFCV